MLWVALGIFWVLALVGLLGNYVGHEHDKRQRRRKG